MGKPAGFLAGNRRLVLESVVSLTLDHRLMALIPLGSKPSWTNVNASEERSLASLGVLSNRSPSENAGWLAFIDSELATNQNVSKADRS